LVEARAGVLLQGSKGRGESCGSDPYTVLCWGRKSARAEMRQGIVGLARLCAARDQRKGEELVSLLLRLRRGTGKCRKTGTGLEGISLHLLPSADKGERRVQGRTRGPVSPSTQWNAEFFGERMPDG